MLYNRCYIDDGSFWTCCIVNKTNADIFVVVFIYEKKKELLVKRFCRITRSNNYNRTKW